MLPVIARILDAIFAALVERADDRPGRDHQRQRRRQGQQHRQVEGAGLDVGRLGLVAAGDRLADRRQDGDAQRGADDRQRQLVEAVGIAELGQRAFAEPGREIGVEQLADLIDAGRRGGGQDQDDQFA